MNLAKDQIAVLGWNLREAEVELTDPDSAIVLL
jgi:hypothetical protein